MIRNTVPGRVTLTTVARTGQASKGRVGASVKALAILDLLADRGPLGTNEIARSTGTTASTVSRHVGTLVAAGLDDHDESSGRYRLGLRLVRLAASVLARLDVRELARPHLGALVAATGETTTLSVPAEPDAITVDFVASPHYVHGVTSLGRPSVAHATAAGKAMLAFGKRRPSPPLVAYTERTITDPDALEAELERVRNAGWAEAYEEREPELNAIAAPVWSSLGELAGILAVQGPVGRFGRAVARETLPLLLEHASALSAELGHDLSPR